MLRSSDENKKPTQIPYSFTNFITHCFRVLLMNILVTGGAGFIGSNFIRLLLNEHPEHKIVNVDSLTYAGNKQTIKEFNRSQNYKFCLGNICEQSFIETILEHAEINAIVNFAAESFVDKSIDNSKQFIDSNVGGVRSLLDAAKKVGIEKFVQISTDEIYGSSAEESFTETSNLCPRNPYSASKAAADLLALSYFITHNVPVVITRSSNNYGPFQHPEKFIPRAITNLIEHKKIPVYGGGKNVRDWLHVEDNCRAVYKVLTEGKLGETYNIGGGNERENIQIARLIAAEFSESDDAIEFIKDRPGHDFRYSLSHEKITKELGWMPQINFEQGLKKTIEWYKNNLDWWKPLK